MKKDCKYKETTEFSSHGSYQRQRETTKTLSKQSHNRIGRKYENFFRKIKVPGKQYPFPSFQIDQCSKRHEVSVLLLCLPSRMLNQLGFDRYPHSSIASLPIHLCRSIQALLPLQSNQYCFTLS